MQRPQVRSTGSSYHTYGCYHAGEEPEAICEGKWAGLIWDGTYRKLFCPFFLECHEICKAAAGEEAAYFVYIFERRLVSTYTVVF